MGDHPVLYVDRLVTSLIAEAMQATEENVHSTSPSVLSSSQVGSCINMGKEENVAAEEEEPLIQSLECRICQEEDQAKNLETPCVCSGSLKPYNRGYTAPPWAHPDETTIDISGGWTITGTPLDLRDPRILAMTAAQCHLVEAEYDEYAATNTSGAAFCRSAALIINYILIDSAGDRIPLSSAYLFQWLQGIGKSGIDKRLWVKMCKIVFY